MIKISVIVPVYNVEKYLPKSIDSIVNQTYKDLEIILVDDGSTDRSGEICDKYAANDLRIAVFHIKNNGVSHARNFGIKKATGKFIMFVDADDCIEPYVISRAVKIIEFYGVDVVYGMTKRIEKYDQLNSYLIDGNKSDIWLLKESDMEKLKGHMVDLGCEDFISEDLYIGRGVWARLVKYELAIKNSFNEDLEIGEDQIWNMKLLKMNPNCAVDKTKWYNYTKNPESATEKFRDNIKVQYTNLMYSCYEILKDGAYKNNFLNKMWESCNELCLRYYFHKNYTHSLIYAMIDMNQLLSTGPWNMGLHYSWYRNLGVKAVMKFYILKFGIFVPVFGIRSFMKKIKLKFINNKR